MGFSSLEKPIAVVQQLFPCKPSSVKHRMRVYLIIIILNVAPMVSSLSRYSKLWCPLCRCCMDYSRPNWMVYKEHFWSCMWLFSLFFFFTNVRFRFVIKTNKFQLSYSLKSRMFSENVEPCNWVFTVRFVMKSISKIRSEGNWREQKQCFRSS